MILFPRQPSLFALLRSNRISRSLFSQSGILANGPLSMARDFHPTAAQHKGSNPTRRVMEVLGLTTGLAIALAWLGWFFHKIF